MESEDQLNLLFSTVENDPTLKNVKFVIENHIVETSISMFWTFIKKRRALYE